MCATLALIAFTVKAKALSSSYLNETFVSSYYLQINETSKGKAKVLLAS